MSAGHGHGPALPALHGGLLALLAATLFGISTPLVQRAGAGLGAFTTAALLYAGASLLLALEAVFTALLARVLYRETLDRRVTAALVLMSLGGMVLVLDQGQAGHSALALWGMLAALATSVLALLVHEPPPGWPSTAALLAIGAASYGLSLRLYLLAQRAFGAARTGSVFAFAPFVGAGMAVALGERGLTPWMGLGCALIALGVWLHLTEDHAHEHAHEALAHDHAHRHDDGHHDHTHEPMPAGAHSHPHRHVPVTHRHAHVPDAHHGHPH